MGYQVGLGFKSDIGGNYYGKVEATYSDFDSYQDSSATTLALTLFQLRQKQLLDYLLAINFN